MPFPVPSEPVQRRKPRILLAEDSRADVLLVREALDAHNLDVELMVKRDGGDVLAEIERMDAGDVACPDLMLLDLNLPRHNGETLLARIRASAVCGQMPVIVVTSSDAARDRQMASRLRASAYFRKPSDFDEFMRLGELVRELLGIAHRPH